MLFLILFIIYFLYLKIKLFPEGLRNPVLILRALKLSESSQKLLNLSVLRGMGRISFSFYILHEPLLHMIGYRTVLFVWRVLGSSTALTYQLGIIIAFAITLVISVWFADIFHRMVDTPCAKFTRNFDLWCR
jgi:peptidoglycan/LPS O-acetylase OafA/YrhL